MHGTIRTDVELVERYLAIKTHVAAVKAVHEAELQPYEAGMATIENEFLRRLNERGADNTKTDAGTAYKSTINNYKVVDRDKFLKFCVDNWKTDGAEMLHVSATKDAVRAYMQMSAYPPPGIEPSSIVRVNIRRS